MDRIDEWRLFAAVAAHRSFAAAARAAGRSPQAVTRSIAALEARLGTRLLHRTTRSVSLTGDGERTLERCRRVLAEFDALEDAAGEEADLRGILAVTAPALFGRLHVLPVATAFLAAHPAVDLRLTLIDRVVSLAEEGIDVAVRIGALPDSALVALGLGQVRLVVCGSPDYLARAGTPRAPADLARHACLVFSGASPVPDRWSFPSGRGGRRREQAVGVRPRLVVNSADAAIDAAVAGLGLVRVLSYQVDRLVAARALRIVLAGFEPAPVPVQLVHLPGIQPRLASAFAAAAAPALRERLRPPPPTRPR
ncbi:MAG TPA: LysR family transcriptional regulator [Kofleriaceae bacterium]|nr:LysR family transcriptional regulator [Kofleriaceae bacterium]